MSLAAPSFSSLMERWQSSQTSEQLKDTIYFARSEAIKRGGNVALQKLPNNTNGCTTATGADNWDCGWFVCEDTNGNGTCGATEPVLQRFDAPAKVEITRSTSVASIKFNRWGLVDGAFPGFSVVPAGKSVSDPAARGVCTSAGGRVHITTTPPC